MEIANKILEVTNTLTEETQALVRNKCVELGFNQNRGEISLEESFINLNQSKNIIDDSIKKGRLDQLPLTIQKVILTDLENVSSFQNNLIQGSDEIVNLGNAIEKLYSDIWQFDLQNISSEVLGYSTKMNQLKNQEVQSKDLIKRLEDGIKLKGELEDLFNKNKEAISSIQNYFTESQLLNSKIEENQKLSLENAQKASAYLATIEQNDLTAKQLLSELKISNADVISIEERIREFFSEIDGYKREITKISDNARSNEVINNDKTNLLISTLDTLENQIKDQLQRATGFSLFHSFQTRQGNLNSSKKGWLWALGVLLLLSIGLTVYVAHSTDALGVEFYLKLSISVPLIGAIFFCSSQYSKERKLEEEYAFKSNISISLIPYQELVQKQVDPKNPQEMEKYTTFLIDAIGNVFTSPTNKILGKGKSYLKPDESLKQLGIAMTTILKPFESVFKLMKS